MIVDRETGSAAELFAGQLQDWAGATVIGEHTAGAGGGWMMGDTPIVLNFSRLRVHLPDHATYRKDGSNATAGVTPDVCVGWGRREAAEVRARRLRRVLEKYF